MQEQGTYRFKGISGTHSVVAVTTAALAGRAFATKGRTAKGELVAPGRGLLFEVALEEADSAAAEEAEAAAAAAARLPLPVM